MTDSFHFALVGQNIGYSSSPQIFEAIFKHLDVRGKFDLCSIGEDRLEQCLGDLRDGSVRGLSVTIPYKQTVMDYLDETSAIARQVNAVNSVAIREGKLIGHNTDCHGFSYGLAPVKEQIRGGTALIVGSGGAARAVTFALLSDSPLARVCLTSRSSDQAENIKQHFASHAPHIVVEVVTDAGNLAKLEPQLVVNCTPLGGPNFPGGNPLPENFDWSPVRVFYDLNYNRRNGVSRRATTGGAVTIDGSVMLVAQALRSFELWTGESVPFEPIYREVFPEHLAR